MKRWGKRIAAIVVCAMMVIGIGPELVTAKGSESQTLVSISGYDLTKADDFVEDGKGGTAKVTSADSDSVTVTLSNFCPNTDCAILVPTNRSMKIILQGTNSIKSFGANGTIALSNSLTITGTGTLNVENTYTEPSIGIRAKSLSISESMVTVKSGNVSDVNNNYSWGIFCDSLEIHDRGWISIATGSGPISYGVNGMVNITSTAGGFTAKGHTKAVSEGIRNEIPGKGWTNYDGGQSPADIPKGDSLVRDYPYLIFAPSITYTVTFKVENGAWNDKTMGDKVVKLSRSENEDLVLVLTEDQIPAAGGEPAKGCAAGAWSPEAPSTDRAVSRDLTYTYTYDVKEIIYDVTEGQGGEHTVGDGKDMVFTVKRNAGDSETFGSYTGAAMNGEALPEGSYTASKGSLILTLKSGYLDTLSPGDYQVKISFRDGAVTANLKVNAAPPSPSPIPAPTPKPVPKTGDSGNPALWLELMFLGIGMLAILSAAVARKGR